MKMIGFKVLDASTVIEYFDDGSKRQVKGLNGYKVSDELADKAI